MILPTNGLQKDFAISISPLAAKHLLLDDAATQKEVGILAGSEGKYLVSDRGLASLISMLTAYGDANESPAPANVRKACRWAARRLREAAPVATKSAVVAQQPAPFVTDEDVILPAIKTQGIDPIFAVSFIQNGDRKRQVLDVENTHDAVAAACRFIKALGGVHTGTIYRNGLFTCVVNIGDNYAVITDEV